MSPRYNPMLTDGFETRSLPEWKSFARNQGFVFEPQEFRSPVHFRIVDMSGPKSRVIKKLKKIKPIK